MNCNRVHQLTHAIDFRVILYVFHKMLGEIIGEKPILQVTLHHTMQYTQKICTDSELILKYLSY